MQTLRRRSSRPEATALRTAPAAFPPAIGVGCTAGVGAHSALATLSPTTRNGRSPVFSCDRHSKEKRN